MQGRVGCDLEYAVSIGTGGYIPAGALPIEGTKGNPTPLKNGGVEIDCCAVEITPKPAYTEDEFASNILGLLKEVRDLYPTVLLTPTPSVIFRESELKKYPHANTMGCSPDSCAWTLKENPKPVSVNGLRSFGGHIHIEYGGIETVKACDITLGMYSVIKDPDTLRRKLYGKAGAYREKPYGVEYRTVSNFWCASEVLIRKMFQLVRMAQKIEPDINGLITKFGGSVVIQRAINQGNVRKAKEVIDYLGIMV